MNNVHLPESISDHMYRMAIISFLIEDKSIDRLKCIKISLVHDMAEAIVGDITPHDGVPKEKKHELEKNAMLKIKEDLEESPIGQEFYDLWLEYEESSTPESKLVHEFDKLELILQASEYEKGTLVINSESLSC
eukprot:TRINITY_DN1985_c0_g1_i2.p1 TRINITY_DN1985_c0_g1~~TRINITY_DN1985_c0_g1_i2.p1  ORF type:complete len:134 (-),score=25.55 TRINITY_DN1985_c0_g1_i2:85-486(-)